MLNKYQTGFSILLPMQILVSAVVALALFSHPFYQDFIKSHNMRMLLTDMKIELQIQSKKTGELPALDKLELLEQYPDLTVQQDSLQLDLKFLEESLAGKYLLIKPTKGQFGIFMGCQFSGELYRSDFPEKHGDYCLNEWETLSERAFSEKLMNYLNAYKWPLIAWVIFIAITSYFLRSEKTSES